MVAMKEQFVKLATTTWNLITHAQPALNIVVNAFMMKVILISTMLFAQIVTKLVGITPKKDSVMKKLFAIKELISTIQKMFVSHAQFIVLIVSMMN
jgi:hypothetical protein